MNIVATPEELEGLSLEQAIRDYDPNWEIQNALTSSYEDAERDDFYNHIYNLLKDALSVVKRFKAQMRYRFKLDSL